jgi:sodium/potassium-transporting ATPase subunit beta
VFNPADKTVLGRSGLSWLAILGFYVAFYAVLAGFWAACLATFMHTTIDFSQPTQQHKYSLLKDNPGITYEPADPSHTVTFISFNGSDSSTYSQYVSRLDSVLAPYRNMIELYNMNAPNASNVKSCNQSLGHQSNLKYVCLVDVDEILAKSGCGPENQYGYANGTPCVFLRSNKIFGYMPAAYPDEATFKATTDNPPPSLLNGTNPIKFGEKANSIYVTCEGENPGDVQNLLDVEFFPANGLSFHFYPYLMQNNYLPPFVMAKFHVVPGRVMMIWCKLWVNNIHHDLIDLQGSVHMEMMVDM